jgi:quinol monooxygenase YgiN
LGPKSRTGRCTGIIYAGGGANDGCYVGSTAENIWPHEWTTGGTSTSDSVKVNTYIMVPELTDDSANSGASNQIQTIRVFAHELGHTLGLPDVYDNDTGSPTAGVGAWSPMSYQYLSTVNLADTRRSTTPGAKSFLGGLTPTDLTGKNAGVELPATEARPYPARLLANPNGVEVVSYASVTNTLTLSTGKEVVSCTPGVAQVMSVSLTSLDCASSRATTITVDTSNGLVFERSVSWRLKPTSAMAGASYALVLEATDAAGLDDGPSKLGTWTCTKQWRPWRWSPRPLTSRASCCMQQYAGVMATTVGLYVRLDAKPGREADVESFLKSVVPLVQAEPATTAWFAIRMGPSTFGIFDVFPDESGRDAHLQGQVAAALMANASELLASEPRIDRIDVLADKLPG